MANLNGPFPRSCLSRFRSESWGSTIVKEMSLICIRIRNSFPFEWLCIRTRFETEASSNSEMGFWGTGEQRWWVTTYLREQGSINHFRDQETTPFPPTTGLQLLIMHTCQPPEYKNLETSRNICIGRMSFSIMPECLRKSPEGLPNVLDLSSDLR